VLDNQVVWPVFVERSWEDVEGCGPAFSLVMDESAPRNCNQLIVNGDAEDNSIEGWWHTAGGISVLEGGADGSSYAFSSQSRSYSSWGIAQFLDTRCLVEGRKYMLRASVKLLNKDGSAFTCTPGDNRVAPCPSAHLGSRVGTTNPENDPFLTIATMGSWATGEWNNMTGLFTVSEKLARAGSVLLAWHRTPAHVQVLLDDITLSLVGAPSSQPSTTPTLVCEDDTTFKFMNKKKKSCKKYLKSKETRTARCNQWDKKFGKLVKNHCPKTCDYCADAERCLDDAGAKFKIGTKKYKCKKLPRTKCNEIVKKKVIREICRKKCKFCG